jgi:hypothetical protein
MTYNTFLGPYVDYIESSIIQPFSARKIVIVALLIGPYADGKWCTEVYESDIRGNKRTVTDLYTEDGMDVFDDLEKARARAAHLVFDRCHRVVNMEWKKQQGYQPLPTLGAVASLVRYCGVVGVNVSDSSAAPTRTSR